MQLRLAFVLALLPLHVISHITFDFVIVNCHAILQTACTLWLIIFNLNKLQVILDSVTSIGHVRLKKITAADWGGVGAEEGDSGYMSL